MAKILISARSDEHSIKTTFEPLKQFGHELFYGRYNLSKLVDGEMAFSDKEQFDDVDGIVFVWLGLEQLSTLKLLSRSAEEYAKRLGKFFITTMDSDLENLEVGPEYTFPFLEDRNLITNINNLIQEHLASIQTSKFSEISSSAVDDSGAAGDSFNTDMQADEDADYSAPKYWLLKINPDTWNIDNFKIGFQAYFNTYYGNNTLRVDHDNFRKVKKGHKILGYAYSGKKTVECVFDATKGEHALQTGGDGISMMITDVFRPAIPLELVAPHLKFLDKLEGDAPERLFPITKKSFTAIVAIAEDVVERQGQFLGSYTTEGNHELTEDHLAFTHDIESFGSVICLEKVKPPLAIGLFGKWGSGKSFFMQKLSDHIEELANSTDDRYVHNVVQVKFNSWHYSDANLWASIITDIFEELNKYATKKGEEDQIKKLSDSLQLTGIQKEAVEQKKKELQAKVSDLQDQQKEKQERLEDLSGLKLLKLAVSDKGVQDDLAKLENDGIKSLIENKNKVNEYIDAVKSAASQARLFINELKDIRWKRWWWLIIMAVVVFGIVYMVTNQYALQWNNLTALLSVKVTLAVSFAGKIIENIKKYRDKLKDITGRLKSLKKTLDAGEKKATQQLNGTEKELSVLADSLTALDKKIAETQKQIDDISSGRKLMEFINDKSRDENYSRQLGLISMIRKDFETLDKLLWEQHRVSEEKKKEIVNKQNVQLNIDRIILYIDDLDRCNEEIVVKVLEAIHLLLAFPLFVVIVGVDPRWLNNALNKKYGTLFQHQGHHATDTEDIEIREPITSYDYLEKIFQIPFALKPVSTWGRKQLLRYLIRDEILADAQPTKGNKTPATDASASQKPPKPEATPSTDAEKQPPPTTAETPDKKKDEHPIVKPELDPVKFSRYEISFMEHISGLFGHTPRSINRYVNIYRIIKSHKNYKITESKSQVDYKATMFLLALILGCPDDAQIFIDKIQVAPEGDMKTLTDELPDGGPKKHILKYFGEDELKELTVTMFKKNMHLIARFSFRTHFLDETESPLT